MLEIKKIFKIIIISLIIGFCFVPITYLFNFILENYLSQFPQRYCYENFDYYEEKPVDNLVLIINKLKYKKEYIEFYKKYKNQKHSDGLTFNFPIITPPLGSKVYVKGFTEDSSLVEIYVRDRFSHGQFLFYVIPEAIHDNPPNLDGR